jgi:hypothetical protein
LTLLVLTFFELPEKLVREIKLTGLTKVEKEKKEKEKTLSYKETLFSLFGSSYVESGYRDRKK